MRKIPEIWLEQVPDREAPWLATLAVVSHAHGRRIGHHAVEAACSFLVADKKRLLYLDCARGFLESFYRERGFRTLAEGIVPNATSGGLAAVLMARDLEST